MKVADLNTEPNGTRSVEIRVAEVSFRALIRCMRRIPGVVVTDAASAPMNDNAARASETRPVRRSESDPPAGRSFYGIEPFSLRFYNKRGTVEQWIKEGKQAAYWTRLSCHPFRANEVRLQLSALAYNLGNLWRRLVLPKRIDNWSLTGLQQRLVETGGRLVKHAR